MTYSVPAGPLELYGKRLHPLGPGWVAMVNGRNEFLTEPAYGYLWLSFNPPDSITVNFNPDTPNDDGTSVTLPVTQRGVGYIGFGLHDYGVINRQERQPKPVARGDVMHITFDWIREVETSERRFVS